MNRFQAVTDQGPEKHKEQEIIKGQEINQGNGKNKDKK